MRPRRKIGRSMPFVLLPPCAAQGVRKARWGTSQAPFLCAGGAFAFGGRGSAESFGTPYHLVALLLYGCGLRLSECLGLRVQCFNLEAMLLTVHDGKGQKDRTIPLPRRALPEIREQLDAVRRLHHEDLASAYTGVFLPRQLRFLPFRGLTKLYAMEDGGAAGGEDHGINDRFFLSARALPSHCSCAVFQRYSVSCQTPSGKGPRSHRHLVSRA